MLILVDNWRMVLISDENLPVDGLGLLAQSILRCVFPVSDLTLNSLLPTLGEGFTSWKYVFVVFGESVTSCTYV